MAERFRHGLLCTTEVVATLELLADDDGTFGARWSGPRDTGGATWDHPSLGHVLQEIAALIDDV